MFGFVQWDGPIALLLEFLLSLLVFIGILFVVRKVERTGRDSRVDRAEPPDEA